MVLSRKSHFLKSKAYLGAYFISLYSLIFLKVRNFQCHFFLEEPDFKRKQKKYALAFILCIYNNLCYFRPFGIVDANPCL